MKERDKFGSRLGFILVSAGLDLEMYGSFHTFVDRMEVLRSF